MNKISGNLKEYAVWDGSVRWFHWINVLAILGLIAVGTVILNGKAIGVSGEGKVLLKNRLIWTSNQSSGSCEHFSISCSISSPIEPMDAFDAQ